MATCLLGQSCSDSRVAAAVCASSARMAQTFLVSSEIGAAVGLLEATCRATAATCAELEACWTTAPVADGVCAGRQDGRACLQGVAVQCEAGRLRRSVRCADVGQVCQEGVHSDRLWPFGMCGDATCDPELFELRCDGDLLVQCDQVSRVVQRRTCLRLVGSRPTDAGRLTQYTDTCIEGADGAACGAAGGPCDEAVDLGRCEGSEIVTCFDGRTSRYDCAALDPDLACEQQPDESPSCRLADAVCDGNRDESCEQGVIGFCDMGRWREFACDEIGLADCRLVAGFERMVARCTGPPAGKKGQGAE